MSLKRDLVASLRLFAALAVVCGGIYSLAVLGVAQGLFPHQANGSLIVRGGQVIGSELIGQDFTGPEWFHGRPSPTAGEPYNADSSTGSNLGPTNPALVKEVQAAIRRRNLNGVAPAAIPPDLVESSGSGLDPDITPAAAFLQVPAIAAARHFDPAVLRALVVRMTNGRFLGLFGHPFVNVLELNLALERGSS